LEGIVKRFRFGILVLIAVFASLSPDTLAQETPQEAPFDRRAMLRSTVENAILPVHEELIGAMHQLDQAVQQFAETPSVEGLRAMQATWRAVSDAWAYAEIYRFDDMMFVHPRVAKRPINIEIIEATIQSDIPLDATLIENSGSPTKGLFAIEYFLFDPDRNELAIVDWLLDPQVSGRRLQYLRATVADLRATLETIHNYWLPDGDNYAETFVELDSSENIIQNSVNMLANQMVRMVEFLYLSKLDFPFGGKTPDSVLPFEVEAWRSRESTARMIGNIEGLRIAFRGGFSEDALGFDDYLDTFMTQYNGMPLSDAIEIQFDETLAALNAIDMPFFDALTQDYEAAWQAHQEVRELLILIKVDMTSTANIAVTFNDMDGD